MDKYNLSICSLMSNQNEDIILINRFELYPVICELILAIIFDTIYTIAYVQLPNNLKNNYMTKHVLAYIICSWIIMFIILLKIKNIIQYWKREIPKIIWFSLQDENHYPFKLLKISNLVCVYCGFYIMTKFVPFEKGCHIYNVEGAHLMCTSIRIISFFTIMGTCILAVSLLCYIYICLRTSCHVYLQQREEQRIKMTNISFATNYLNKYNPIQIQSTDEYLCSICLENAENNHEKWMKLNCEHKFHTACMVEWLNYSRTCPQCRAKVILPQNVISV